MLWTPFRRGISSGAVLANAAAKPIVHFLNVKHARMLLMFEALCAWPLIGPPGLPCTRKDLRRLLFLVLPRSQRGAGNASCKPADIILQLEVIALETCVVSFDIFDLIGDVVEGGLKGLGVPGHETFSFVFLLVTAE